MSWTAIKTVESESTGEKYYIKRSTSLKEYSCTCKSFIFNQEDPKTCKHIREVVNELKRGKPKTYWIVARPNGDLGRNDLFATEPTAKWWAGYCNDHFASSYSDYKAKKITLKRSK